jgi:transcriptional/translational regulatory protein YebC/TACO1
MSGHNKWSQIKRQKGKTDAEKSKAYSKYARLISMESKKASGNLNSPALLSTIEKAKKENVPKDVIDRAVKKGMEAGSGMMESITYEAYGPGGCAIVIEALTDNRNKAAQEIKHILINYEITLAGIGSATWAFSKTGTGWDPTVTVPVSDEDIAILEKVVRDLENNDEVQAVFINAE